MKYSEYTATHKLYREIKSIKRAHWLFVFIISIGGTVAIALAIFAGCAINDQFDVLSRSVGASALSQRNLENEIWQSFESQTDAEFKITYVTKHMNHVVMKINCINMNISFVHDYLSVPSCSAYETHIKNLISMKERPVIHNIYLYTGSHGLGKTYAAYILAQALSRFDNVVLVTIPMYTYIEAASELNLVCDILHGIDVKMKDVSYTMVWLFDELDTYLMNERNVYNTKDISEFAEMCDFTGDKKRILAFAMNNGEILKHNYWEDQDVITKDVTSYVHYDDLIKAIKLTHSSLIDFMTEGQLSRLASFVGNKVYNYEPFDRDAAKRFIIKYLASTRLANRFNETTIDNIILQSSTNKYSTRQIIIRIDDLLNGIQ
ncbi:ORF116 protein [Operophtera brumata nucleopolyhedrovirus]|uniref:ORF116 protein n=1 Tax=Operophtera brumata nucleopolyhedrovirus TaxID=1046267 RepID=A0A2H4UZZ9_9ABAC|nr:ORF116 protein [Operophtera brumata nucleopolyhedrovirus]AUA60347.1 ORF116 protein [Operophtera brumata nucleopolyhedrovirus]